MLSANAWAALISGGPSIGWKWAPLSTMSFRRHVPSLTGHQKAPSGSRLLAIGANHCIG